MFVEQIIVWMKLCEEIPSIRQLCAQTTLQFIFKSIQLVTMTSGTVDKYVVSFDSNNEMPETRWLPRILFISSPTI